MSARDVIVQTLLDLWHERNEPTCRDSADAILAALAAAGFKILAREPTTCEYGWLIERGDSPVCEPAYWGWSDGHGGDDGPGLDWTKDHHAALRFARKIDAERYAQDAGWNNVRICEHGWNAAPPATQTKE